MSKRNTAIFISLVLILFYCHLGWSDESDLIWSTFLGGTHHDYGNDIALDETGYVYVIGTTKSFDFPTTAGAFDTSFNDNDECSDAYIVKLNPTGTALVYATLLGGSANEDRYGRNLAGTVDSAGCIYVTGDTHSDDFPTTVEAFDATYGGLKDAFVAKFQLGSTTGPVVSEAPPAVLPETYYMSQNYPNPFNTNTEIRYQIIQNNHMTLTIFNTLGQEIQSLVDAHRETGSYTISWDG